MQISVDNVVVRFGDLTALGSVSCQIGSGEFVALLGPSGCGKSTLIRVLAGLQAASEGAAFLDTQPVTEPHEQVGLMFQKANLMPWRTVRENIALPLELAGFAESMRLQAADDVLPLLGLEGFEESYPAELSGGMAQRVALGRVLVRKPQVLLLDEPFGALDALTRERISLDLLRIRAKRGQTVLMVTHNINEAVLLADRVLVMSQRPGRIISEVTVPLERPRTLEMVYTEKFTQTAKHVRDAIDRA